MRYFKNCNCGNKAEVKPIYEERNDPENGPGVDIVGFTCKCSCGKDLRDELEANGHDSEEE